MSTVKTSGTIDATPDPEPANRARSALRLLCVMVLGFASGIPLALTGGAMQAWLTIEGIDLATIGFLSLVAVPYTFKFLWAPLLDRFEPPWLGRRRGWIVLTQLLLAAVLFALSHFSPSQQTTFFAALAMLVAFVSASQDIVIDAYRSDLLAPNERGLGASLTVLGYRTAMVISGGVTLIWAQQWGSWSRVYLVMAAIMAGAAVFSLLVLPRIAAVRTASDASGPRELAGFFAMLAGVAIGYYAARWLLILVGFDADTDDRWIRLLFVVAEMLGALALGMTMAKRFGFATLNRSLASYFAMPHAWAFLLMIVLYKIGDAFAMSLTTPFLIRGLGFEQLEVGLANKSIGLLMTIAGALLGGLIMLRVRLAHALLAFGVLQLVSNYGYYLLATQGRGAWGAITVPAFDLLIVALDTPTPMDTLLLTAIGIDNLSGGMGTAALLALLMSLCNARFSATQFALLSAFASLGRVFIGPFSGVFAEQVGWPRFFLASLVVAVPGVLMVWWLRRDIESVEQAARNPLPA
ncbi:MAG: MFS transporter [Lysobacterales bacterium]